MLQILTDYGGSNQGVTRCFLDGVFQIGVFRGWPGICKGRRHQMPENIGVFGQFFFLCRFASVASRGEESEKYRLENSVWNP